MAIPTALEALRANVDPKIEDIKPDELIPKDLVVNLFAEETFNQPIQTAEAGYVSVYGVLSTGNTRIGDTWAYRSGDYKLEASRAKTKKGTTMVEFSEDAISRIRANDAIFIKKAIETQIKMESRKLSIDMEKMAFPLTATDPAYDKDWVSPLAPSSANLVANPSDCNRTPGTAEDLTAVVLTGTAKTKRNTEAIAGAIETIIAENQSADTDFFMDWDEKVIIVPPVLYALLNVYKDLKTDVKESDFTYLKELEQMGYKVVQSRYADPSYTAVSDGNACKVCVIGSPKKNFLRALVPADGGFTWTEWKEWMHRDNGLNRIVYEKHKKFEWFMLAQAYSIMKSDGTRTWKKPVVWLTITPFKNTAP